MTTKILTENNPTAQAFEDLCQFMADKGYSLEVGPDKKIWFSCRQSPVSVAVIDIEKRFHDTNSQLSSIPPDVDYKLCYSIDDTEES